MSLPFLTKWVLENYSSLYINLISLRSSVWEILDFVYPNDPVFRSVGLFKNIEFEVFVAYFDVTDSIVASRLT